MANHCWPMAEMEGFEPPDGLTRQLISSQPRYDHFDTSPCCIFKALRVSVRLRAECRNRRTKRRKTVDIQLLKSVDNPEKPEISRVFGDGPSTDLLDFECGPFNRLGTSPNLCYIPGPDPPTNSAGGNREEQQDRTSNIIQFELGWNPHGSKGFSRLALRIGNLISNHYTNLDDNGKSGTIAVTTEPQNIPLKVAVRWLLSL